MVRITLFAFAALVSGTAFAVSVDQAGSGLAPAIEAPPPPPPRFYFPRHVKRQGFSNSSTPVVPIPQSTTIQPEVSSTPIIPVSTSAINSVLSSVLSSIFQPSPTPSPPAINTQSTQSTQTTQLSQPSQPSQPTQSTQPTLSSASVNGEAQITPPPTTTEASTKTSQTGSTNSADAAIAKATDSTSTEDLVSHPTAISATGSDTATSQVVGTAIVTATTPSPNPTTSNAPTGISSEVPRLVKPPDGIIPVQPDNTTLVQIGFNYPLNYYFVVSSQNAIKQIFWYLPQGVAYGLGVDVSEVTMQLLEPYDTTRTLGYVTTLAKIFIRKDMLDALSLAIHQPASRLYSNPDPSVHALMSMINPSIPIQGGDLNNPGGGSGTGPSNPQASTNNNDGAPLGSNSASSSSPVSPTSVGIGCGVVAGAAIYGAAMFFIARRYKQRRMTHRRSPSLIDTASMSQTRGEMVTGAGAALMGGARQHNPYHDHDPSGRTSRGSASSRGRDISAPVMAENSLGWN